MGIVWNQRIAHFDRPVKRRDRRELRKALRVEETRHRRGLPARVTSFELVIDFMRAQFDFAEGRITQEQATARRSELDFLAIRERMLQRKRTALRRIRARKANRAKTCINLWMGRATWLESVEASRQPASAPQDVTGEIDDNSD